MDFTEFETRGREVLSYMKSYHEKIRERRPVPKVKPGFLKGQVPDEAPEQPEEWKKVFGDVEKVIMPGMTHWQSPHFHAFYPAGNSYPAMFADMLSNCINCVGFSWISSPICTELETAVTDWLAKLLQLPEEFLSGGKGGGCIQGSSSESTFLSLLAARSRVLSELKDPSDALNKLVVYGSEQAHSSVERACLLAAVKFRSVPSNEKYELTGDALEKMVKEDLEQGLIPFYVVATLGTTACCAFDRILEIGPICQQYNLWLHIDAAYAGSAFICPEFRPMLDGIEMVDSFNFSPHKWMPVSSDCSLLWLREKKYLTKTFELDPIYFKYKQQGKFEDYRNWQISSGRRFRSLKLWFVLRLLGAEYLRNHIRNQVNLAKEFENLVRSDDNFEVVYPVKMGLVCFRLKGDNAASEKLLNAIVDDGRIYLIPGRSKSMYYIRFVVCSLYCTSGDMQYAWNVILQLSKTIKMRGKQ